MSLHIVYRDPGTVGYHPVLHMVRLAAELLGGKLIVLPQRKLGYLEKLSALLTQRRRDGRDICLMICAKPPDLDALLDLDGWKTRYAKIFPWVFDAFWFDFVPRFTRFSRHFDHVFVTEPEDMSQWQRLMGTSVTWLPWGSDVLRLGSGNDQRDIDLLRVGRQPPDWENDARTRQACDRRGVAFHGRPEAREDATENETLLMRTFARTKFSLSFSNSVNPAVQTHPTREYITARWVDAAAAGAIVAGVAPKTEVVQKILWPEALLELATTDLATGLDTVEAALRAWTPERADFNHRRALERLDWRWRLETLASALGIRSPRLETELGALRARLVHGPQSVDSPRTEIQG